MCRVRFLKEFDEAIYTFKAKTVDCWPSQYFVLVLKGSAFFVKTIHSLGCLHLILLGEGGLQLTGLCRNSPIALPFLFLSFSLSLQLFCFGSQDLICL